MGAVDRKSFSWRGLPGPYDPEEVERAKELAAGGLGVEMASFSNRFVVPVTFGEDPKSIETPRVRTASLALLRIEGRALGITCHHVLKKYRKWRQSGVDIGFQLGNWTVDPDAFLIDESEELDLAVLDLSDAPTAELRIAAAVEFFEPSRWPPPDVTAEEFVTLGGYPAQWRLQSSKDVVEHAYWGLGTTMVTSVSPENVCCAFEREHWVQAYGPTMHPDDLTSLGGMSGSPVFVHRGLAWDFVGIVHQHHVSFDLLRIRPGRYIRPDRTLDGLVL